ncbi:MULTISPECIES: hypothetical protein [Streptomyces]|nr:MULTISPECIES: hypothetical protein [Streptomyces]
MTERGTLQLFSQKDTTVTPGKHHLNSPTAKRGASVLLRYERMPIEPDGDGIWLNPKAPGYQPDGPEPTRTSTTLMLCVLSQSQLMRVMQPEELSRALVLPRSERWDEAMDTALLGNWSDPLWETGRLPSTALGTLKAEARTVYRQLVPLWRRGTRHGRMLSLDAELSSGLTLYDLVAADVDLLHREPGGVFDDERLNAVLRHLDEAERRVVFALAEGAGTTWAEAAAVTGAAAPVDFGEQVRRKAKRLAAEQQRRAAQRWTGPTRA